MSSLQDQNPKKPVLLYRVTVPGPCRVKKNGQKVVGIIRYGRPTKTKVNTPQYTKWQMQALACMISARNKYLKRPIDFTIQCKMVFYFKNHQHEADLSALYEGPQDELKKANVILDDRLICSHDGSRKIFGDKNERTEIEIYRHGP